MTEQLRLPIDGIAQQNAGLSRSRRIYVNRNLSLAQIDWVGFDMDYTLAIYDQHAMDMLSIQVTAENLVKKGYPTWVTAIRYDPRFAIRGILIDKKHGHVVKMDRYKSVGKAYRGFRQLNREQVRTLYHASKHRAPTTRYHFIDTLYALSEASVYAAMIDAYDARELTVDHQQLFNDIREAIDEAHRDGTVYAAITGDLPRYVKRDVDLAATLHKLRSAGKKLFILTNSRRPYTDTIMTYLLGNASAEYPTWRHYFDVAIVGACKPAFFQEHRPLLERAQDDREDSAMRPAQTLERGRIYEGGNVHDFERLASVASDRVLYVGDHIYGDILRSKKESAWRTVMIIQEMDTEVDAHERSEDALRDLLELEDRRARLEDELRFHQARFKDLQRQLDAISALGPRGPDGAIPKPDPQKLSETEAERTREKRALERVRGMLREAEAQAIELEEQIDRAFHPYFGSLLKEGTETSSFGDQVEEYACLYTARVSNLLAYSPLQTFRSPRDLMPHEL